MPVIFIKMRKEAIIISFSSSEIEKRMTKKRIQRECMRERGRESMREREQKTGENFLLRENESRRRMRT